VVEAILNGYFSELSAGGTDMSRRTCFFLILIAVLGLAMLSASAVMAAPPDPANKVQTDFSPESSPSVSIRNDYLQVLSSTGGRFLIGTTGGDPNTPNDDHKRLLYGYPNNAGTSFSTVRIVKGGVTKDYRLGSTNWASSGLVPSVAPSGNGTAIATIWEQDGVRIEERLYFTNNADTGRPDTTALEYTIKNYNASSVDVGLRIMLDVMIGENDGAPYFIVGTGQVTQEAEWRGTGVPEYWIAYESATFDSDSLKGRGQLIGPSNTRPDRFVIAHWGGELCSGVPGLHESYWDYTPNPNFQATCDSAVALYYNPVSIAPGQTKTYRTNYGIARSGEVAKFELQGMEVTQAVQNWKNEVVLIEDKPTVLRVHVRSTSGNVQHVRAKVIGTRIESNGTRTSLGEQTADNRGGEITVLQQPAPQRRNLDDSFYFQLPSAWTKGTLELKFELINQPVICLENGGTDGDCTVQVHFAAELGMEVRLVGIAYTHNGTMYKPSPGDYMELADRVAAIYPISSLDWEWEEKTYNSKPSLDKVNADLDWMRRFDLCLTPLGIGCKRIYYGVLKDCAGGGCNEGGLASGIPAWTASGYKVDYDPLLHAHEIGHDLGRHHAEYCDAKAYYFEICLPIIGCQRIYPPGYQAFPYANGYISPQNVDEDRLFYGFDLYEYRSKNPYQVIRDPKWADLMTYCDVTRRPPGIWISDWTYNGIYQYLRRLAAVEAVGAEGEPAEQAFDLIGGNINLTQGTGVLRPIYTIQSDSPTDLPASGAYSLRLEDGPGNQLSTINFDPAIQDNPDSAGDSLGSFVFAIPHNPAVHRVLLIRNGRTLAVREASARAPSVTLLTPIGGEVLSGSTATVLWSGSDLDGDSLDYVLQYSSDAGMTWQTLTSGWASTSYVLNLDMIAGSNQALLRVLASDGFFTTQSQSGAVFTVSRHAPQAYIKSSRANQLYVADQNVFLEGSAYDNEDKLLNDAALTWSSNLNGSLGTGKSLVLKASNLAEGTHVITLTARDSDGQTSTTTGTIQVFRTRPTLPPSLSVVPMVFSFDALQNGEQTAWQSLSIRNSGDGAMTWSASADQGWIRAC
jgi:hypothetical protein